MNGQLILDIVEISSPFMCTASSQKLGGAKAWTWGCTKFKIKCCQHLSLQNSA